MRGIILASALAFGLAACATTPSLQADSESELVSQKLLHTWVDCVRASYRIDVARTPDKNEAAERAFLACSSEENDFRSAGGFAGEMMFPSTKAAVKEVVINNEPF